MLVLGNYSGTDGPLNMEREDHRVKCLHYRQGEVVFYGIKYMINKQFNYGLHAFSNMGGKKKAKSLTNAAQEETDRL